MSSDKRSASHAIRGYAYQFGLTILEILSGESERLVTIEGCEDVDVEDPTSSKMIQCKYFSAQKYSLPAIREAIIPMLRNYAEGCHWDYRLYAHFGQGSTAPSALSIDDLDACLIEKRRKNQPSLVEHCKDVDRSVRAAFLSHFEIIAGPSYEDQERSITAVLSKALNASAQDVADLHYASAMNFILQRAVQADRAARQVTREQFLSALSVKTALFTRWHAEFLGHKRYFTLLKRKVKAGGYLNTNRSSLIVLDTGEMDCAALSQALDVVQGLAQEKYGVSKLKDAKPWTVVLEGEPEAVRSFKSKLLERGVVVNDGYEELGSFPEILLRPPVITLKKGSQKIEETSYDVRVVSAKTWSTCRESRHDIRTVMCFGRGGESEYAGAGVARSMHIRGLSIGEIAQVLEVSP